MNPVIINPDLYHCIHVMRQYQDVAVYTISLRPVQINWINQRCNQRRPKYSTLKEAEMMKMVRCIRYAAELNQYGHIDVYVLTDYGMSCPIRLSNTDSIKMNHELSQGGMPPDMRKI